MKNFGYTIAETLITLAIIGVIGALTLPTFVSSHRNQTNAAALSVAISNLENGLSSYIIKENSTSFSKTTAGESDIGAIFVGNLDGILALESTNKTSSLANHYDGLQLKNVSGQGIDLDEIENANTYVGLRAKNGIVYFFNKLNDDGLNEADVMMRGGALTKTWANVIIDVNGTSQPNSIGRDIFLFDLGDDGILYPCGSLDYSIKNQDFSETTWQDNNNNWTCEGDTRKNLGFGCTARLIDENFKPTY